jgi:hypothetical protein
MSQYQNSEEAVDQIVVDPYRKEPKGCDSEDPEILSSTTEGTNDHLLLLSNEHGVSHCSRSISTR